jgi:hypothetical protein
MKLKWRKFIRNFGSKTSKEKSLSVSRRGWEDNIKMYIAETGF